MTYEEAIKTLSRLAQIRSDGYYDYLANGGKADDSFDNEMMAFDLAIEALEKQIPKKPIIDEWKRVQCVNEHNFPVLCRNRKMPFCPFCGQAIDWSDDE